MGSNPSLLKGQDLPVDTVSWDDVQEFLGSLPPRRRALSTGCLRRRSGSMPAGRAGRSRTQLPTWTRWLGGGGTPEAARLQWAGRSRMPGGYTTCGGTCGSGPRIGTAHIRRNGRSIPRGRRPATPTGWFAGGRGASSLPTGLGAPIASTAGRASVTTTSVSGVPGLFYDPLHFCPFTLCLRGVFAVLGKTSVCGHFGQLPRGQQNESGVASTALAGRSTRPYAAKRGHFSTAGPQYAADEPLVD